MPSPRETTISVEVTREELFLLAGAIRQQAEHLEEHAGRHDNEVRFLHDRANALYGIGGSR